MYGQERPNDDAPMADEEQKVPSHDLPFVPPEHTESDEMGNFMAAAAAAAAGNDDADDDEARFLDEVENQIAEDDNQADDDEKIGEDDKLAGEEAEEEPEFRFIEPDQPADDQIADKRSPQRSQPDYVHESDEPSQP